MRLVPRLLALGLGLPLVGLVAATLVSGSLFRRSLTRDVDERLFAQAAIESVSLFDGPERKPHVHMPKSPLAFEVAAFAPVSVLYDSDGHVVAGDPAEGSSMPAPAVPGQPRLDTSNPDVHTLTVGVDRPGEGIYTLHLIASLAPVEATMGSFYRSIGGAVLAIALALFLVLYLQGRVLTRRVRELIRYVPLIRAARPPATVPAAGSDELSELGESLVQAAHLLQEQQAAQERFLANAAHQLRTPLAILTTEIDLALRRPRDPAELKSALESTRSEAARLTQLARKLLDFESLRVQPIDKQEVDLRMVVRDIVERRETQARAKDVSLAETSTPGLVLKCDSLLVSQAIENLVDNALRFSPPNTKVEITAERKDKVFEISVSDQGPGIPEAERDKVFEPFFRGSAEGAQTGLGLAFVADVVRKHGGHAALAPRTTGAPGTTVVLSLPVEGMEG